VFRGQQVLLDADLAPLYGVPVKALNQAVRRNLARFPDDFMFQLDAEDWEILRSQSVTSSAWGGRRSPPYAFTEQGVAMLSSVLSSERAVQVNIAIMRTFVRLRQVLAMSDDLAHRLAAVEQTVGQHEQQLEAVIAAIRQILAEPSSQPKPRIGFRHGGATPPPS
jgi:hypothetical protein